MNHNTTDELRTVTKAAFDKDRGSYAAAAIALGVSKAYVSQVLNDVCGNDEILLKLADFIEGRLKQLATIEEQKKVKTSSLKIALAL